jgi:hypothetical protein
LLEWIVFYEHEPWGYEVEERRHCEQIAMMLNCVPRKGGRAVNWTELYRSPWGDPLLEKQGWTQEQIEFLDKRKKRKARRKGKK